ncbi:MAG: hypothetical protein H8D87_14625 [Deltaproteobacteria bacterium]|uniref:hypothetical protein n=1 Tax=Desulfobacula sp. TaxID=2593537 RepID=UPI0019ACA66D|nr:hypothetical protein [Candidatus Desulfobacula maris]MBL6994414.1 hypothetical protein [Desulfobacula sp.]
MAYEIIWETKGAQFVFKEGASYEEVWHANNEFVLDARFPNTMSVLYNLIDAKKFSIKPKDIKKTAEMDAKLYEINPDIKIAIVGTLAVMKVIICMYKVYLRLALNGKIWEIETFNSIDDARKWLDTKKTAAVADKPSNQAYTI